MSKPLREREYASWLEEGLRNIQEEDPQGIAIIYQRPDGSIATGYWNCSVDMLSYFAADIYTAAMYQMVKNNAADIVAAAEDQEDTEDE